jgi:hypothetical protein
MAFPGSATTKKQSAPRPTAMPLANERCDACGAPGLARAQSRSEGATLVFCRHHAESYRERLEDQGFALATFYEALDSSSDAA